MTERYDGAKRRPSASALDPAFWDTLLAAQPPSSAAADATPAIERSIILRVNSL